MKIRARRWPWQRRTSVSILFSPETQVGDRYGWIVKDAMGRFGGGWNWCLGIDISRRTVNLKLIFGIVSISWS